MSIRAQVDRVENGIAVLIVDGTDEELNTPTMFLPKNTKEGTVLSYEDTLAYPRDSLLARIDNDETARRRALCAAKIGELEGEAK